MTKRQKAEVASLLLNFQALDRTDQSLFIEAMNQYLFAAPKLRRDLVEHWSHICSSDMPPKACSTRIH
jgi:hypothetical protein